MTNVIDFESNRQPDEPNWEALVEELRRAGAWLLSDASDELPVSHIPAADSVGLCRRMLEMTFLEEDARTSDEIAAEFLWIARMASGWVSGRCYNVAGVLAELLNEWLAANRNIAAAIEDDGSVYFCPRAEFPRAPF